MTNLKIWSPATRQIFTNASISALLMNGVLKGSQKPPKPEMLSHLVRALNSVSSAFYGAKRNWNDDKIQVKDASKAVSTLRSYVEYRRDKIAALKKEDTGSATEFFNEFMDRELAFQN